MNLRRSTETSVHLDDHVFAALGVKRVLDVTLTNDTDVSNDLDGGSSEHVVFLVCQSLRRGDDDRVTGMRAEGIKVFHVAADDGVLRDLSVSDH
jgi:hypothetical protein